MHIYGPLESLLRYPPPPEDPRRSLSHSGNPDEQPGLEGLLEQKADSLKAIMGDVSKDMFSRQSLSKSFIERLYIQYFYLKAKLFELSSFPMVGNRAIESRRSTLEKQLDTLLQEKRQEQVKCWEDIAALKKELRGWLKQYFDMVQRLKLVLPKSTELPR